MKLYIYHQKNYALFLLVVFLIPLALFFQFSPYDLPKVQYVVLAVLFFSQYMTFNEKSFHKRIEKRVSKSLSSELGRTPSRNEIAERSRLIVYFRGITISACFLFIMFLMFYFKKF